MENPKKGKAMVAREYFTIQRKYVCGLYVYVCIYIHLSILPMRYLYAWNCNHAVLMTA